MTHQNNKRGDDLVSKTLGSNASIKRFVSKIPSAIADIDADLVDDSIKVLSIDGKKPGDQGYFLSDP